MSLASPGLHQANVAVTDLGPVSPDMYNVQLAMLVHKIVHMFSEMHHFVTSPSFRLMEYYTCQRVINIRFTTRRIHA